MTINLPSRRVLLAALTWGAVWGLYEATVGYLVHAFARMPGTSAVLLVPFAVFCLMGARTAGGLRASVLAAVVAASIKLVNLLLPNPTLLAVLNPAMAIVMEGLVFAGVVRWLRPDARRPSPALLAAGVLVFSLGWRVVFLAWSAALAAGWSLGTLTGSLGEPFLGFVLRDGLLSALVIMAVVALTHRGGRLALAERVTPGAGGVAVLVALAVAAEVAVAMLG